MIIGFLMKRLKLREWAAMDDSRKAIKNTLEDGELRRTAELFYSIVCACSPVFRFIPYKLTRNLFWLYTASLFVSAMEKNLPAKKFPILQTKSTGSPETWEYEGRGWFFWLNLFAESYGWNMEKIAKLDIDEAIGLYQEIIASQHVSREWEYGLSEFAYEYISSTKQSKYRPLPKPDWMLAGIGTRKTTTPKVKILKSMMPVGNVFSLDGNNENIKETEGTKSL